MTKLVGILNLTPDSFSDGGRFNEAELAKERIEQLFEEGAHIIDIGAESTRPGSEAVVVEEEWRRLEPIAEYIADQFNPANFSFDTRHGEIVRRLVAMSLSDIIVNDISSLHDPEMRRLIVAHGLRLVISHMPRRAEGNVGTTHSIQMDSVDEVAQELTETACVLMSEGAAREQIIIDPGIGFGKTPSLNRLLLQFGRVMADWPVMVGYSHKRFIGEERMDPEVNALLGLEAAIHDAAYLRVHDVAVTRQLLAKYNLLT